MITSIFIAEYCNHFMVLFALGITSPFYYFVLVFSEPCLK